jgi:hypothetical protein
MYLFSTVRHCSRYGRLLLVSALNSMLFKPINVRITWKNTNVSKMAEKIVALQHTNLKLFYNITVDSHDI